MYFYIFMFKQYDSRIDQPSTFRLDCVPGTKQHTYE